MTKHKIALSSCPHCGGTRVRQLSRNFWGCPDCFGEDHLMWISRAWKNDPHGLFIPISGYSNNPKVVKVLKEVQEKHGFRVCDKQ